MAEAHGRRREAGLVLARVALVNSVGCAVFGYLSSGGGLACRGVPPGPVVEPPTDQNGRRGLPEVGWTLAIRGPTRG